MTLCIRVCYKHELVCLIVQNDMKMCSNIYHFSKFKMQIKQWIFVIFDFQYSSNIKRLHSAPYRTITVRDCMSDLPNIKNGHKQSDMSYGGDASTHFQRLV